MQKFRNSFLLLVLAAVCLPQTATQLVTPEIRRVGDKLACKCGVCNNTGYKGRVGLYEVMEVDDEIKDLVLVGASAGELKKKAIERGMITLRRSGLIKAALGQTTLEEVARETIH